MLRTLWTGMLLLLFAGCDLNLPVSSLLGPTEVKIPISAIDTALAKAFPVTRKARFGTVKVLTATTLPNVGGKSIPVEARFNLVTFEIPEGVNGIVTYQADIVYDPLTRSFYLTRFKMGNLRFTNRDLVEYVSMAAAKGTPEVVATALAGVRIYRLDEKTKVSGKINGVLVGKKTVTVRFGK
ncbi:hypothetical protein [Nitratifractor sp.]